MERYHDKYKSRSEDIIHSQVKPFWSIFYFYKKTKKLQYVVYKNQHPGISSPMCIKRHTHNGPDNFGSEWHSDLDVIQLFDNSIL